MRGLRHRIETIIEEVNREIRLDLGLELVEEESEEAKAFERELDEIEARYESIKVEIEDEFEESEEGDISEKSITLEDIINHL